MKDKMKKSIIGHLKEDRQTFKREAEDDKELIKRLEKSMKTSKKMPASTRKKTGTKMMREARKKK